MQEQWHKIVVKIIIPALIVSIMGVAVDIKHGTARFWNSFLSILISVGGAYLASDFIFYKIPEHYIILTVSLIAILSDKIISWLLYEFKIDDVMGRITDILINRFKNKK